MNIEQVPKPSNVDADPVQTWGRLPPDSTRAKVTLFGSTGALMTACWQEEICSNTGDPAQCEAVRRSNRPSVRTGQGCGGSRRGSYYRRSRVTPVEGRGLGSRAMSEEAKAGDWRKPTNSPNGLADSESTACISEGRGPAKRSPLVCESMNPLERKPDARDGHVRFDERGVETERMTSYSGTGHRKGRTRLRPGLNATAPLLDSTKSC